MTDKKLFTITTDYGREVPVLPVAREDILAIAPQVEKEFRDRGEVVDPPAYEMTLFDGTKERVVWDEKSVEKDGTDEDKAAWKIHAEVEQRMDEEGIRRTAGLLRFMGGRLDVPKNWVKERKALGLPAPDDLIDLKVEYLISDVFRNVNNVRVATARIQRLGLEDRLAKEGALDKLEALFRGEIQDYAPERPAGEDQGAVDVQPGDVGA